MKYLTKPSIDIVNLRMWICLMFQIFQGLCGACETYLFLTVYAHERSGLRVHELGFLVLRWSVAHVWFL